jgi:hypothetical protein
MGSSRENGVMAVDDDPAWQARDALYAQARRARVEAFRRWRKVGGYIAPSERNEIIGPVIERMEMDEATADYYALSEAALPNDPALFLRRLEIGSRDGVDAAIEWLEEDHFCRHSGYTKQKVMRRLARAPLTPEQAERVRALLLAVARRGPRQEFREARRLARRVDGPGFRRRLRALADSTEDEGTRWRAEQMLGGCERTTPRSFPTVPER